MFGNQLKHVLADPSKKLCVRNYVLRRAQMFVPGDSQKKIDKAMKLDVDSIVLDCEDGVAISKKGDARINIRKFLEKAKPKKKRNYDLAVRLNSNGDNLERDVSTVLTAKNLPNTVLLPKVEKEDDLTRFSDLLNKHVKEKSKIHLMMGIESALAFVNLRKILEYAKKLGDTESSKFLPVGVFFGNDDFCASIGASRTDSSKESLYARQKLIVYGRAFNLQVIDMVYIKYKDLEGLKKQAEESAMLGFSGKQVIHPDQVPIVQQAFYPSEEKIKWAEGLLKAFDMQQKDGKGAFEYEGDMIDLPTMKQAQNIMELCFFSGTVGTSRCQVAVNLKNNNTTMEKHLDRVMEEMVNKPGVFGCVFVDHQGLCLGAKGKASTESAGLIAAIAEQVAKLEPHSGAPIICLEGDSKSCIIQRSGTITGAIYKTKTS